MRHRISGTVYLPPVIRRSRGHAPEICTLVRSSLIETAIDRERTKIQGVMSDGAPVPVPIR